MAVRGVSQSTGGQGGWPAEARVPLCANTCWAAVNQGGAPRASGAVIAPPAAPRHRPRAGAATRRRCAPRRSARRRAAPAPRSSTGAQTRKRSGSAGRWEGGRRGGKGRAREEPSPASRRGAKPRYGFPTSQSYRAACPNPNACTSQEARARALVQPSRRPPPTPPPHAARLAARRTFPAYSRRASRSRCTSMSWSWSRTRARRSRSCGTLSPRSSSTCTEKCDGRRSAGRGCKAVACRGCGRRTSRDTQGGIRAKARRPRKRAAEGGAAAGRLPPRAACR